MSQTAIPIENASFELPALDPGLFTTTLPDWTNVGSPSSTGALHPSEAEYPTGAADGNNIAFVVAVADGDGISQILSDPSAALKPGAQYTLTVQVGNNTSFPFEGYRVELLAGGVVLADDENSVSPANGTFELVTVSYTYDPDLHAALLGEPLEIRLLSTANASGETNFDDVQLTVTFTESVADAGGPYSVFSGGSLQLDASGSVAADGESITAYEWDLNNDGTFGDVTGVTPTAISFEDLIDEWDMQTGSNTIQLRITDSADNIITASTTVTLQDGIVVLISDLTPEGATIEDFFTDNFTNVAEIRHGDFANFSAQATQDALNGTGVYEGNGPADVVVIGRSLNSGSYQNGASDGYNTLEIPVICFTSYVARQDGNRLGWHASAVTTNKSVAGDETTVTPEGAAILGLAAGTHDLVEKSGNFNGLAAGDTAFGDGKILATIGGDTLAAFWEAGDAPGNPTSAGVATFPGPRLLFNLDNDPNAGNDGANDFTNLTEAGLKALISAIQSTTPLAIDLVIVSLQPENNAEEVYPGTMLVATFSKNIALTETGTITLKNLDAETEVVINLPDPSVSVNGPNLIITPPSNLAFDSAYAVRISPDAIEDLADTPEAFPGINDDTTWTFTTAAEEFTAPVIVTLEPENEAENMLPSTALIATFDQNIVAGTGNIVIRNLTDDEETVISAGDGTQILTSGNTLTIAASEPLAGGKDYAIRIDPGAIRNFSDIDFAGIEDDTTWSFSTIAATIMTASSNWQGGVWSAGQPGIGVDAVIAEGVTATANNSVDPWSGTLTLEENATLSISSGSNPNPPNMVFDGATQFILKNGSRIFDNFKTMTFTQDFIIHGTAGMDCNTNAGNNHNRTFTGTISGGTFYVDGRNHVGYTFNAPNTFANFEARTSESQRYGVAFNAPGAAGLGNVTVSTGGGDQSAVLILGANDVFHPSCVLTLNGKGWNNTSGGFGPYASGVHVGTQIRIRMDSFNATVAELWIDNVRMPDGQYTGTDGDWISGTGILTVGTPPIGTPYDNWAAGFTGLSDTTPTLDFDGGGLATALEWVLGGDPTDPSDDAGLAPTIDNTTDPDGKLRFTFRRNSDAENDANTTIAVEYSTDLVNWTAAAHEGEGAEEITISVETDGFGSGIDAVTVALPPTLAADSRLFARLNVEVAQAPAEE